MHPTRRNWDSYDGYLFDIDGTLLTCTDLIHYRAFNHAMTQVARRPITIDGVVMQGNVDVGILRDAFALHGVDESVWRPHRAAILDTMGAEVSKCCNDFDLIVHPRVQCVLEHLKQRGAWLATATGNLASIGKAKLQHAGLLHAFDFGGWSDVFEHRVDVFRSVAHEARRVLGQKASLCAVGDTPSDIHAARSCGISILAVATGPFSAGQLSVFGPDYLVDSFDFLTLASAARPN